MKMNTNASNPNKTHEGAFAVPNLKPLDQLKRSVFSCFLWEKTFYEDGEDIVNRIREHALKVTPEQLSEVAIEARKVHNIRHTSLLLAAILAKHNKGKLVRHTIEAVICRADELTEFLVIYAHINNVPPNQVKKRISAQVKKGLAAAFVKFDAYQLAKYNRDSLIKLRDVLFLCHAKPKDDRQAQIFKELVEGKLSPPDTWEVALSGGKDKKETFTRLITEKKLGYFALLRNLRNMRDSDVDHTLMKNAIMLTQGSEKILPFRFVAAARACPSMERELDIVMMSSIVQLPLLDGTTIVLVDVSGSMDDSLSSKSDMTRMDAACALAGIINSNDVRVFSFSQHVVEIPPRKGMSCIDAIRASQPHGGTYLGEALNYLKNKIGDKLATRLIVITDEQTHDNALALYNIAQKNYLINVGTYKNGIGYGKQWVHIDGFSENVIKFIYEHEKLQTGE